MSHRPRELPDRRFAEHFDLRGTGLSLACSRACYALRREMLDRALGKALQPGGLLLVTDTSAPLPAGAAHDPMRPLAEYRRVLEPPGFSFSRLHPTHVRLNRELGASGP